MATNNRLWGAERIRGELLKVGIKVAKRTVQRYMRQARPSRPHGQTWATFLHNHANDIWACDFLQVHDVFFRPLFAFFITELGSRRIVHVGVTRSPSDAWVAQQLREATPFGQAPEYLIRDNDAKYGAHFDAVASRKRHRGAANADQSTTGECDLRAIAGQRSSRMSRPSLIVSEAHLRRVLKEYVAYFNRSRPHQGINQRVPEPERQVGSEWRWRESHRLPSSWWPPS